MRKDKTEAIYREIAVGQIHILTFFLKKCSGFQIVSGLFKTLTNFIKEQVQLLN
jgi:hypothetical protein